MEFLDAKSYGVLNWVRGIYKIYCKNRGKYAET
jgi:hypothetical protein